MRLRDTYLTEMVCVSTGNRPHLNRDARHPGGPADTPTPVREEHRQLQAKDRPAGGRPPAHSGSSHL